MENERAEMLKGIECTLENKAKSFYLKHWKKERVAALHGNSEQKAKVLNEELFYGSW